VTKLEMTSLGIAAIAVVGIAAYVLERKKQQLDQAVDTAFKPGGFLAPTPTGNVTEGSAADFIVDGTFGLAAVPLVLSPQYTVSNRKV
jgi:hypothetical protein